MREQSLLRADTTLAPQGDPAKEIYVRRMPLCCLNSLTTTLEQGAENGRRLLSLGCSCRERWIVTSSADPRVLERFVTHAGPKVREIRDGQYAA